MTPTNARGTGCDHHGEISRTTLRHFVALLLFVVLVVVGAAGPAGAAAAANLDRKIRFDIPPQTPLDQALIEWGRSSGMQVMMDARSVAEKKALGVHGLFSARAALEVLLKHSGLVYSADQNTVRVGIAGSLPRTTSERPVAGASSTGAAVAGPSPESVADNNKDLRQRPVELEEVVVTGSHLRNVEPISPVKTLTQDELVSQGYTNLEDALQQLPQSFSGGGATPGSNGILAVGNGAQLNGTYSSGANLRGLGTGATLVLINGRRLPQTSYGESVDISHIPLSAIDRVEIVTDGASAIYGSDAIAGVVNIITKRSFEGLESEVRVDNVAAGKSPDSGGSMTGGIGWTGGNALVTADYERTSPLFARARPFAASLPDPTNLIPRQETLSVYAALRQDLTAKLTLSSDLLLSKRSFSNQVFYPDTPFSDSGRSNQGIASIEADYKLDRGWLASLTGQFSRETDPLAALYVGLLTEATEFTSGNASGELRLEGPLLVLPGGSSRLAFGMSFRRETFTDSSSVIEVGLTPILTNLDLSRSDTAAYGELFLPLVGADNAVAGVRELSLDLAGRYDHYSDFGNTLIPKIALRWAFTDQVMLHGTYARSFRAPPLFLLSLAANNVAIVADLPDPSSPAGVRTGLLIDSNNPDLKPERATSRTLGLELRPSSSRDVTLTATWFQIDFGQRIEELFSEGFFTNVIQEASVLGSLVNLTPTLDQIEQQLDVPGRLIQNFTGQPYTARSISAIADIGYVNVGESLVRGIDQSMRYAFDAPLGRISTDLEGSYLLDFDNRITPASHPFSIVNTPYNPPRWRGKLNVGWSVGALASYIRLNEVGSYRDPSDPRCDGFGCHVASWTTIDVGVAYTMQHPLRDLRLSAVAFNVFDRRPPFINNQQGEVGSVPGVNYDPNNANALARTVSLTVSKRW